jgi:RHS repeat-associated protein
MSKGSVTRFFLLWGLVLGFSSVARSQVATGTPPFGSFGGGPDIINLANLNSHLTVPVLNKAGRGLPFSYNLTYDSSIWYPVTSGSTTSWQPVNYWGWGVQTAVSTGYVNPQGASGDCYGSNHIPDGGFTVWSNWSYTDQFGATHPFAGTSRSGWGVCAGVSNLNAVSTDGSGYTLQTTNGWSATIISRAGKVVSPPFQSESGVGNATDNNGNQITVSSSGVFTDTLGTTVLAVSQNAPGPTTPTTFTYTPPGGTNVAYTMNYTSFTVATNFGISGVVEYGATAVPLVSSIVLPDGTQYTFTYEATPSTPSSGACTPINGTYAANCVTGRLATVELPTGGILRYAYSAGNNGILSDGSTATLTRTTPDGTWKYAHSESGTAWTTTVTDPQTNQTVLNFQGIYETERQVYEGSTSGTLLKTVFTCYNGNTTTSTCDSTAITLPITQRSVFRQWPAGGLQSRHDTFYNAYGSVTEKDEYAYGSGAPGSIVRKTLTTYASLGNGIVNRPASVTLEDGSSNVKARTTYCYDEATPSGTTTCGATGAPTATSGTPQHVAVSGSRGNVTTIAYLVQGSTTLGKKFTYYDTGNVLTATDVNGAQSTYTYASSPCNNSFATSVSEPLSLTRSMIWSCTGGVETSATDENSQIVSITYNDPDFWRPNKTSDQESNITNFTYTEQTSAEAALNFSSSTSDILGNVDSLGRTHVSQVREAPGSTTYDSVETDYDSMGRPSKTSLPYSGSAGQTDSSAPGTSTTYDALSRKYQVTDSAGRTVTFAYTQNDTYRTVGPAPTGENTKRKQSEYDALGRLTSVCEITSATGSGTCGQTSTATGYWTTYTYDLLNDVTGVTQNAQSTGSKQTRTYIYDDLKRMTSETNPESGTTTYTYDTDASCGTSKGDLVKKIDAVGDTICYAYDLLHRPTSITVSSGTYASSTPIKKFVYDSATVNGVAMSNVKRRLAEAYTCTGSCTLKITDLGFSYTVRGEASDAYESTPNSGGYYHISATYWPNGALDMLTAKYGTSSITDLPTFTYAPDGEGRISTVSASSGQNPVTATAYSVASLATQVTFGSSDSDSFTYDPNSNRMTKYTFDVNGQSVVGTLTWNSIGTLESLAITDPFYGAGNQTCAYTHDDMSRIASANCGSPWSQTFSYDAFGNISKSGTVSFQPTYSYLTNHMTQVGSSTPTYDANGNATNDTAHTYSWDANGRPVTTDTASLTYDALGRMVEQNKSGTYYQIVYSPAGAKFAILSGSTLQKAFVQLPGGSQAVYTSSGLGLTFYRHSDWIGSSRFASTPTRTMYYDGAYAPFGEAYAQTGTADLSYTGMNQDTVANLYDFPAREYNDIHGRWPSPDPAGISSARLRDPQTWNRYAYVRNSPLHLIDPTGMMTMQGCDDPSDYVDSGECAPDDGSGLDYNPDPGGSDPADPSCPDPTSCDPSDPNQPDQNQCNSDTCQTATACNDSTCTNQTVMVVNGGSLDDIYIQQVSDQVAQTASASAILETYGGSVVTGAGGYAIFAYGSAAWGVALANAGNVINCVEGALSKTPGGPGLVGMACSFVSQASQTIYNEINGDSQ